MLSAARRRAKTIERALTVARPLVAPDGDIDTTLARIAARRQRVITITELATPPGGPSGAWVKMAKQDLFIVKDGASPTRREAILCHELGHLLLDHKGELSLPHLEAIAPDVPRDLAARYLARHGYDDEQEREAELFATLLLAELKGRQQHIDMVTARLL